MAKGAEGKKVVVDKIKEIFGDDYIGEQNNKHYVWVKENGERIQIAISLTCPKNPIGEVDAPSFDGGIDFTADTIVVPQKVTEVSEKEQENIRNIMERLGL